MSEETTVAVTEPERPEREIEFMGRQIWVRMPRPEQVLVWRRTIAQLQKADSNWNGEQVLAALERTRKIIDSVMANRSDIDWLDDEMLEGTVGLQETTQIVLKALAAFGEDENRSDRRAAAKKAAPVKKAARKKAS
jgi:hypothetical protein